MDRTAAAVEIAGVMEHVWFHHRSTEHGATWHGAAHCVLQPVEESSSRHHVVAVLSEKMEICRVQCWGGGGQLGANRGQPCAASLLHSDLLSTIYPLQDNNGTLKT